MKTYFDKLSYLQDNRDKIIQLLPKLQEISISKVKFYKAIVCEEEVYICFEDNIDDNLLSEIVNNHKDKEFVFL